MSCYLDDLRIAAMMQPPPRAQRKVQQQLPGGCQAWQHRPLAKEPLQAHRPHKTLLPLQRPIEWQVSFGGRSGAKAEVLLSS